ncbi:MAG TPA: DNA repair protein RecN [Ignavibacteria bacterium]|nr:DNA repair protein RecN [Ignavibacteria bacterium]
MLEKLTIKNYLLLKNIEIDFSGSFNVITGETGAGKSILINAFSLLLGERADYSIINKNKEKMVIEGIINLTENNKKEINRFLKSNEIEVFNENQIIIRRELYIKGYSRNFINDSPAGTNELKQIGDIIVDIHSQNEHQSLLKKEVHIQLLDSYISKLEKLKFDKKIEVYETLYNELLNIKRNYEDLKLKKDELDNKKSFLEFQLKEITEVSPSAGEDERLEKELKTSENVEAIQQGLSSAYFNLYEDTGSVIERLKTVEKELSRISEYNNEINKIMVNLTGISAEISESSRLLQGLIDNISHDPERIEQIRERLYKLQFLKKKYGGSLEETLKIRENLSKDLSLVDNFDEKIKEIENDINLREKELLTKAKEISKIRKENSKKLESETVKVLNEVGFENAGFKVEINSFNKAQDLTNRGIDDVEFLIKVNKGDEFSSLRKTASGGEISRIMLAIKTVLSDADKTGVLVFDEIDAGISGRIAQKVGRVMKKLSSGHQIIAITHLAQIAALAEDHFLVEKEIEGNTTLTKIRKLDKKEKVIEVAKLLSGEKVTDASIKSAKELIES